jgi:hypothetical protein
MEHYPHKDHESYKTYHGKKTFVIDFFSRMFTPETKNNAILEHLIYNPNIQKIMNKILYT